MTSYGMARNAKGGKPCSDDNAMEVECKVTTLGKNDQLMSLSYRIEQELKEISAKEKAFNLWLEEKYKN